MPEEKAIPEPFIVKTEMLASYTRAALALSKYLKSKDIEYYKEFKIWIRDLFFWLEMKIDFKNKDFVCLRKLQAAIRSPDGEKIMYADWIDFWFALRRKMEDLNITKIEMEEEDLGTILRRP